MATIPQTPTVMRRPPMAGLGGSPALDWVRRNLFNTWFNTAVTLLLAYLAMKAIYGVVSWGFVNAVWTVPPFGCA